MVKLHANMHGYRPDRALDWLRPAMKVCAKYNTVVLIHTGDGPYTIPTMFYPVIREFPMEYSVELKRLIDLEMEGSVG